MNNAMLVHLFAEDRAHEEFVKAVLQRLGREAGIEIDLRPQSVRGGHGRTLSEFKEYQKALTEQGVGLAMPDLVVVVIDTNCRKHAAAHREIADAVERDFQSRVAIACPDPHVELWYMADPDAIKKAIGVMPILGRRKCERYYYKQLLVRTIWSAGIPPTLAGIEFAQEIVKHMDWYVACKRQRSFKYFLDELRPLLGRQRSE